ncbi:hypothetical protein E1281_01140 [Actinomadura sp. KC345]|uniref:hypothetical protein n=1 Tax=Actinomadura sp. KC345 TaxID=2530371 RepID=UPI00104B2E9C|nr:hypothetical protein [Actinomadura sp. KC345]TDC58584.1 hypothetical protein E1281_01140 [Actinomadura sp. KC345]
MPDDPTLGEVVRLIERNHAETREGFAAINARLDRDFQAMDERVEKAVPREVYDADQRGLRGRVGRVEDDVKTMRATTRWAIGLCLTALLGIAGLAVALLAG